MIKRGILHFVDEGSKEPKDILSDRDRLIIRQNGEIMNVLQWGLSKTQVESKGD
jgi:hypothetical protein